MDRHSLFKRYLSNSVQEYKEKSEKILLEKDETLKKAFSLHDELKDVKEYSERLEMHCEEISSLSMADWSVEFQLAIDSLKVTMEEYYRTLASINNN